MAVRSAQNGVAGLDLRVRTEAGSGASGQAQSWEETLLAMAAEARHPAVPRTPIPVANAAVLERAYSRCDEVISEHGKTFYMASRLLPPAKRRAIRALYAFCRVADDIVDCSDDPPAEKAARLADWGYRAATASPPRDDLVAVAWANTRLRYGVPYRYSAQLIEGIAQDLNPKPFRNFGELATYAYGVASTVGLMSLHIIGPAPGCTEEEAIPCVIKLGLALQITNILRDIAEDRQTGRIYLPTDELQEWGISDDDLLKGTRDARWRDFMRFQVERNRILYRKAWPCIRMFSKDGRFAVAAACGLYSGILDDIERHNYDVFTRRAHVSTWGKLRRLPPIWWGTRNK